MMFLGFGDTDLNHVILLLPMFSPITPTSLLSKRGLLVLETVGVLLKVLGKLELRGDCPSLQWQVGQ